jgi:hypothetical protein
MRIFSQSFPYLFYLSFALISPNVVPQYDESSVMRAYIQYQDGRQENSFSRFKMEVHSFYDQSPLDCLEMLERNQNNWDFMYIFWRTLKISPIIYRPKLGVDDYNLLLPWIFTEVNQIFQLLDPSNDSKFKLDMEIASFLIKMIEKSIPKLKSISKSKICRLEKGVEIGKFLIKNIPLYFTQSMINIELLFPLLEEIRPLILAIKTPIHSFTLEQSKPLALLWIHLNHIWSSKNVKIFDFPLQDTVVPLYLSLSLRGLFGCYDFDPIFFPFTLVTDLIKLYQSKLNQIEEVFREVKKYYLCKKLSKPLMEKSYLDIIRIVEYSNQYDSETIWKLKALAKLEQYIRFNK